MAIELVAGQDDAGRRLDRILRKALPDHPLSLIHRLLRQGKVLVNNRIGLPDERIQPGAIICITTVNAGLQQVINHAKPPAPLPEILWRDHGIIIFNKPPGLATHGPHSLDTLVQAHISGGLPASLSFKPGPLHRLDRPTSGAIAFSETLDGARFFSRLLRDRAVAKTYLAILTGSILHEETWKNDLLRDRQKKKTFITNLAGTQNALTAIKPLACNGDCTLVQARIYTGKTHQIRAQAAAHGHPLLGDRKYGGAAIRGNSQRGVFFLHAWKIEFAETPGIVALPPESFLACVSELFGEKIKSNIINETYR